MSDQKIKGKAQETPRQREIRILAAKGKDKRSDQESARLDQLRKEEKRERFLRLAAKRVQKSLKALSQVANLGNRSTYEYTAEEAAKIGSAINEAVERVCDAFCERTVEKDTFAL